MDETLREWFQVIVQWALFLIFLAGFLLVAVFNGTIAWRQWIRGVPEGPSFAPLIGGVLGGIAVLAAPFGTIPDRLPYIWIPAVLDAGTGAYFLFCAYLVFEEFVKRRRRRTPE